MTELEAFEAWAREHRWMESAISEWRKFRSGALEGLFGIWSAGYRSSLATAAGAAPEPLTAVLERCAKLCDEIQRQQDNDNGIADTGGAAACAAAIRALAASPGQGLPGDEK